MTKVLSLKDEYNDNDIKIALWDKYNTIMITIIDEEFNSNQITLGEFKVRQLKDFLNENLK